MCFGADGASVLQGSKNGVTQKLQTGYAPHMLGVHYVAHRSNLAATALSDLEMISRLENLLVALHKYFSKSPKRHLALEKLSELLQTKDGKILRQVSKYRILLIKMYGDLQEKKLPVREQQRTTRI
jgi:hypothetical protein